MLQDKSTKEETKDKAFAVAVWVGQHPEQTTMEVCRQVAKLQLRKSSAKSFKICVAWKESHRKAEEGQFNLAQCWGSVD